MLRMRVSLPDFQNMFAVPLVAQNLGHNQTQVRSTHIYVVFRLKRCHCHLCCISAERVSLPAHCTSGRLYASTQF